MPFLLPVLGILFGLALIVSAVLSRPWSRIRPLIGTAIILAILALLIAQERTYAQIDLNPTIPRGESLAGAWRRERTILTLATSGRWQCAQVERGEAPCDADVRSGRWSFHDGEVELLDSIGARVLSMPVITDHGGYRLLKVPDPDPDSWDVSHGYERVSSESH